MRRHDTEHTPSGAIILWGEPRPTPTSVLVVYPCCGRTLPRDRTMAPALRRPQPVMCADCHHDAQWRGDDATDHSARGRARRTYRALDICEHCHEAPAIERHHKDGNTHNNAPDNIVQCCRKCHMVLDGRLAALDQRNREGRKTHCPHGHEYTPDNTRMRADGSQSCRTCHRERMRRRRALSP